MHPIEKARKAAGLSRPAMSKKTGVPVRTIENWEAGVAKCPAYVERLIIKELEEKEMKYAMIGYTNGELNELYEEFETLEEGKKRVNYERWCIKRDHRKDSAELVLISEFESGNYDHIEWVVLDGEEIDFDAAVNLMDDEIREKLHGELAPCTDQEFLDAYCEAHKEKFNEDFCIN